MNNWSPALLGEILPLEYGKSLPASKRVFGQVPVYSSAGHTGQHDVALVPGPCIIIGRKGSVGTVFYETRDCFPIDTVFHSTGSEEIDLKFGYYALLNENLSQYSQDSAVPGLNRNRYSAIEILLPPFQEQQAIAKVLGALDDKIAVNTKIGETLESYGSARFARLGLDSEPSGEGIKLDDLFDLNPRRIVASGSATLIDMRGLPTERPLVEEWTTGERKGGARFRNGDTLVARITPCLENRKTAFVDFLEDTE